VANNAFATVALIVGSFYATAPLFWLLVHPFTRFWRRRGGPVIPIVAGIWLASIAGCTLLLWPWRLVRLYETWLSWIPWALLSLAALAIYRRAGDFGVARLIGQAELRPQEYEQRLVTTGMHARIRHPLYLAHGMMLTAWTIGAGTWAMLALWIFGVVSGALMIRLEDAELERRFGEEFRQYRQRVPAILPLSRPRP
jgi:protein-S-isoprenylcysteine O-methyltransferase Ste14